MERLEMRINRNVKFVMVLLFVSLFRSCLSVPTSNDEIMEKLENLTGKVDSMDEKLDILIDQDRPITTSTKTPEGNEQVIATTGNSEGNGATVVVAETDQNSEDYPYDLCVNLNSVERNPTEDGNRFTVRFTKNAEEIFYRYHDDVGPEKVPDSVVEEAGGVWAVSFTCGNTSMYQISPWFTIGDVTQEETEHLAFTNSRHLIHLKLENAELTAASQDIPVLPALQSIPAWEVVYEPGQDFNVTGFVTKFQDTDDPVEYMYTSFNGIDLQTGELHMNVGREQLFQDLYLDTDPNKVEEAATLLTSTQPVSGYITYGAAMRGMEGTVVNQIQLNKVISVRPSNQSGVIPPGYLGIFDYAFIERSAHGNQLFRCGAGYECWEHCFAIGETISQFEVTRVLPDGSQADVPSAINPSMAAQLDTIMSVYWQFQAEENSGDSDGITTFQCKATDAAGKVVTKLVDVLTTIDPSIDHELSSVEIEHDPMNAAILNVTFNCAVRGRPLPDVTFSDNANPSYLFDMYYVGPESVIATGPNEGIAKKVVTLDLYYLSGVNGDPEGNPFCEIYVPTSGETLTHSFEMPHIDW